MIIIREIEIVVILVPRTGSGSLYRAIKDRYPKSQMLYRHMEADGVPNGYDLWKKVGVVRNPVDRLWSLYKFQLTKYPTEMSFTDWLLYNTIICPLPYNCFTTGKLDPFRYINHAFPENIKSQYIYLRPDLGTRIYHFENELSLLQNDLDIKMSKHNESMNIAMPELDEPSIEHIRKYFSWELNDLGYKINAVHSSTISEV